MKVSPSRPRGIIPLVLLFCLCPPALEGQEKLALDALPALVLQHDTTAALSAQTTLFALHTYQGTVARALPQIDLSTSYSLGYTPSLKTQVNPSPPVSLTDYGTHSLDTRLTLSQLLPTAGSLLLNLEDTMTVSTIGSQDVLGVTSSPDPRYSQAPRVSLGLTQPLFLNGKLMDFGIFPATLRKAQLGYLEQSAADLAQRNSVLGQAVQVYLAIVQLRKNVAQTGSAIELARGNLASLQRNYDLGLVAEADLLDAKLALSRQEQGLLELSSTLAKSERLLAHSVGMDGIADKPLSEEIPEITFTLGRQEAVDRALAAHPLLRQKSLSAEEKRIDTVLAGQQFASTLSLSFSWSPRYPFDAANNPHTTTDLGASFSDLFGSGSGSTYSLSAGLAIRLYDGGTQKESLAASAALAAAAERGLAAQAQAVRDQVELDFLQRASLERKISILSEAAGLAVRRLATERSLLTLGKSTENDVSSRAADAQARADDVWRARADLYLVLLDLHSLAGDDLVGIIEGKAK